MRIARDVASLFLIAVLVVSGCSPKTISTNKTTNQTGTTTIPATTNQTGMTTIPATTIPMSATTNLTLQPDAGSFLSSKVLLKNMQLDKGISDKVSWPPPNPPPVQPVQMGDPIWVITGTVQNQHPEYKYITINAYGYDDKGNEVAMTLDSFHRLVVLELEKMETCDFTLHLSTAANLTLIRLFAHSYPIQPP